MLYRSTVAEESSGSIRAPLHIYCSERTPNGALGAREVLTGDVVGEVAPRESVQLDFGASPNVLSEQLRVYEEYCRNKFPMVGVESSDFLADAGNEAAYKFYMCASESGLCSGANSFEALNCEPGDRAFHIRKGGRVAPPFIAEFCNYYGVAPSQLIPNTWKILISYIVVCVYKGWTPFVTVIRHLFQLQKRKNGWYAFQVRRGKKNKFPGPENNRLWQPKFFGIEVSEGIEWGIPIQWREINASERNGPRGWVLSEEEKKHANYLQRVKHSPKKLCHWTRLYLCGLAPRPDAYDKMPALEMGTMGPLVIDGVRIIVNARGEEGLEPAPGTIIPEATPELFEVELDPELPMMSKAEMKVAVQAGMAARNKGGQTSKGKGGGKKRSTEDPPPKNPKNSAPKKLRTMAPVRVLVLPTKGATSSSALVADVEGATPSVVSKATPSRSSDRDLT
ncbi:hypothetical protein CCACVL1_06015, partial [Corchorus capsularis]